MARIVFDLDGTLIDSVLDLHGIANAIMNSRAIGRRQNGNIGASSKRTIFICYGLRLNTKRR